MQHIEVLAFHALVRGRVQGVGFRYSAVREARRLGVSGWVKNTKEGHVETWAEGSAENLEQFLGWLHSGPPRSRVDTVSKTETSPRGYNEFFVAH